MERIELVKEISGIDINSLLQIGVDENLQYLRKDDGINVVGCLDISGLYTKCDNSNCVLKENISVDMNILYENIQDSDKFRLYVEDFSYDILDNNLILRVFINFDSYKDVDTTFPATSFVEMSDSEPLLDVVRDVEIIEDSIIIDSKKEKEDTKPFLSSLFRDNSYSKSVYLYVLKEDESVEDVDKMFNVSLDEINKLNRDKVYQKGDLISIPLDD